MRRMRPDRKVNRLILELILVKYDLARLKEMGKLAIKEMEGKAIKPWWYDELRTELRR